MRGILTYFFKTLFNSIVFLLAFSTRPAIGDQTFDEKLKGMLQSADKSIRSLQQQIVQSQSAPFLPDLYLQLADLHSQKSTTLYFIQKERVKDQDSSASNDKAFAPLIEEQQEAIKLYRLILKDFPDYENKRLTLFRLCIALKSIDENAGFAQSAGELIKNYPGSEQASSIRLILGLQLWEQQQYEDARKILLPVVARPFPYERNLARYRLGLVDLSEAKFRSALTYFEQVINDQQLKAEEDSTEVGLKKKITHDQGKTDLKHEALLKSVQAYTFVFENNADPVTYYSRLAPNEPMFKEAIEALAQRYIHLKKIPVALDLLRSVGQRTSDPARVLQIYRQVLVLLPKEKRAEFPPQEMRYVLGQYIEWANNYATTPKAKAETGDFLEKQLRELATSLHESARTADPIRKKTELKRAADFYKIYLAAFKKAPHASDMALDLADVYFRQENYLDSGDYYLRLFQGEFGKVKDKKAIIENAILCLQKKTKFSFYGKYRMRGLLIASLEGYLAFDKSKAKDPNLNFLLAKSRYDQGFFPSAIDELYEFAETFKKSPHSADAAELILDYYNTQNDFTALVTYSDKLLALKIPNPPLNGKLKRIRVQAQSKEIREKIRSLASYNEFEQGKSYLDLAMASTDVETKNKVLKEALSKSQSEGDIQTFIKVAVVMAEKEKDLTKKQEIILSLAQETTRVSQYYQALGFYRQLYQNAAFAEKARVSALEQTTRLGLMLRDWNVVQAAASDPLFNKVSQATQAQLKDRLLDYLDSPLAANPALTRMLYKMDPNSENALLIYFKAQQKIPTDLRMPVFRAIASRCVTPKPGALCGWAKLASLDRKKNTLLASMAGAPRTIDGIKGLAQPFNQMEADYRANEGTEDPFLESVLALRHYELFVAFGNYLKDCAQKIPNAKAALEPKVAETFATAKADLARCRAINEKSIVMHPAIGDCITGKSRPLTDLLKPREIAVAKLERADSIGGKEEGLKRAIFSNPNNESATQKLAQDYISQGYYSHAAALSTYGTNLFKDREKEFRTFLGCSVLALGYLSEAKYQLSESAEVDGLRSQCLKQLDSSKK